MTTKYKNHKEYLKIKEEEREDLCIRCGGCCGVFDDPCKHLKKDGENKCYCEIYAIRLGERRTVSGEEFRCVPIMEVVHNYWKNQHLCAYKKRLKRS